MRKAIDHLRRADPILAAIIDRVGPYKATFIDPEFGSLVRSIVYQQLSGKAAATIFGRLLDATGRPLTPDSILALDTDRLRTLGLSKQKAAYIRDLAEKTAAREVVFEKFPTMTDKQIVESLTRVKGIGVWTVQMYLMFALRRPDVLPTGDLGIRNAIQKAYNLDAPPTPAQMEEIGACWRPYCSIASWYLWRSLE
ncbi:MAG TPA: DNA-3-methyladenine glycosylase [Bryobacteraceae bacterium]|nr:DNA-3-methyladenine glycosylase [Bryobacteraceae bacterium]